MFVAIFSKVSPFQKEMGQTKFKLVKTERNRPSFFGNS